MTQVQTSVEAAPEEEHTRNLPALIAVILAALGAGLAILVVVVPGILLITFVPLLTAFALAIVGLNRQAGRSMALAALIISVVFATMGPILYFGRAFGAAGAVPSVAAPPDTSKAIPLGLKVVNSNGIELTARSAKCGDRKITDKAGTTTKAQGRFCVVKIKVKNGSAADITMGASDVSGLVRDTWTASAVMTPSSGSNALLSTITAGLTTTTTFAIDVPKKVKLEYVLVRPTWPQQGPVVVKIR